MGLTLLVYLALVQIDCATESIRRQTETESHAAMADNASNVNFVVRPQPFPSLRGEVGPRRAAADAASGGSRNPLPTVVTRTAPRDQARRARATARRPAQRRREGERTHGPNSREITTNSLKCATRAPRASTLEPCGGSFAFPCQRRWRRVRATQLGAPPPSSIFDWLPACPDSPADKTADQISAAISANRRSAPLAAHDGQPSPLAVDRGRS